MKDLEQAVHVIRALVEGRGIEFEGTMLELPWTAGHPLPVWIAGYGPVALKLTGRIADGAMLQIGDPDLVRWFVVAGPRPPPPRPAATRTRSGSWPRRRRTSATWRTAATGPAGSRPSSSNHVVDLVNKYPREDLPAELTTYVHDREGYDYLHHAEVGSSNASFVTDEIVDRFCLVGRAEQHIERLRDAGRGGRRPVQPLPDERERGGAAGAVRQGDHPGAAGRGAGAGLTAPPGSPSDAARGAGHVSPRGRPALVTCAAAGYAVGSLPLSTWITRAAGAGVGPAEGPGLRERRRLAGPRLGTLAVTADLLEGACSPWRWPPSTWSWGAGWAAGPAAPAGACWPALGLRRRRSRASRWSPCRGRGVRAGAAAPGSSACCWPSTGAARRLPAVPPAPRPGRTTPWASGSRGVGAHRARPSPALTALYRCRGAAPDGPRPDGARGPPARAAPGLRCPHMSVPGRRVARRIRKREEHRCAP